MSRDSNKTQKQNQDNKPIILDRLLTPCLGFNGFLGIKDYLQLIDDNGHIIRNDKAAALQQAGRPVLLNRLIFPPTMGCDFTYIRASWSPCSCDNAL
ncbi:hypothetical protein AYI72_22255 [Shewanella algae]|nr:hypothetical protein BS332_15915 [Shewanella algae]PWF92804.1 hypothetical protein DD549_06215 [Shewanella algae]TVK92148.1 hypothetical protein AYI72_22255 [Shewanella algae]UYA15305.1 hypothetical protein D3X10_05060 [Shewanella algae]